MGKKERNTRTDLIDTAKLKVTIEVLLVERLQARVEQARDKRRLHLLDDFGSGFFSIMFGDSRTEFVVVEVVLSG